jgi:hypothetical protein
MSNDREVVVQMWGGLGNQLFQYAMGRRLALASGVPLVLDHLSGFPRDYYRRKFSLDKFNIQCGFVPERASYANWTGRMRRRIDRWRNAGRPLEQKYYVQENSAQNLERELLELRVQRRVFFEGYWQHEEYFRDCAQTIQEDFQLKVEHDAANVEMAAKINAVNAVCLHVRRLHGVPQSTSAQPLMISTKLHVGPDYYQRALDWMAHRVPNPHFFVFADYPEWARENVHTRAPIEFVTHNGPDRDYEDFWLMSQCRHFIIANSTFSWWAAWLGQGGGKQVVAPAAALGSLLQSIPPAWQAL